MIEFIDIIKHRKICNSGEYRSGLSVRFNRWLWSQNKHKFDAELPAAREKQNWFLEMSIHSYPDFNFCVNSLTYIL